MAGLVLSIAVLATGTIVQSAEAAKPLSAKDPNSGTKITCKVTDKPGSSVNFGCVFHDTDGIDEVSWGPSNRDFDCQKRVKISIAGGTHVHGTWTFTVTDCAANTSTFDVTVENQQVTSVVVNDM